MHKITKIPYPDAAMIIGYYSLGHQCLVKTNSVHSRTALESDKSSYRYNKTIDRLTDIYTTKQLRVVAFWPKTPFYGVPATLQQHIDNPAHYNPKRLDRQPDNAPGFTYTTLHHQVTRQAAVAAHNRFRRRALIDNDYRGRPFFIDQWDAAHYKAIERSPTDKAESRYIDSVDRQQAAFHLKGRVPVRRKPITRQLTTNERIHLASAHLKATTDNLLLLVDLSAYYRENRPLDEFQPLPGNILHTCHNALAFYLYYSTKAINKRLKAVFKTAQYGLHQWQETTLDYECRTCAFLHPAIDIFPPGFIRYTDPDSIEQNIIDNHTVLPQQRLIDSVVAATPESAALQKKLLTKANKKIHTLMPGFTPAWSDLLLQPGNLLHGKSKTQR